MSLFSTPTSMELPKGYSELTVEQYQQVNQLLKIDDYTQKWVEIIACLSGKSISEIEDNTPEQIKEWANALAYLVNSEPPKRIKKVIMVGRKFFSPQLDIDKIKTSQVLTLKHLDENGGVIKNLNQMLACIYTPSNLLGKPKEYDGNKHEQYSKIMLKAKIGDVYGTLFFYSNLSEKSNPIIQIYLSRASKIIKNHMEEVMKWAKTQGLVGS